MNFLDMRTIVFTMLLTNCICTGIVAFLWYRNRTRYTGLFYCVLDFAFQTIGVFLLILRNYCPDWLSIVVSNTTLLSGTLLGYIGLESFTGKKSRQIHNIVLIGIFILVQTYFAFIQPDLNVRNVNLCLVWMIITLQCFWLMAYRADRAMRPVTFGVGMVYGAMSVVQLVRIAHILAGGYAVQDWFQSGPFESYILLCYKLICILLAYSLVFMVNKRLLGEMELQEDKFSKAFHASPYGVLLTRLQDGKIFEVNEGFEKITGYLATEIVGKTTMELHIWASEDYRAALVQELTSKGSLHDTEVNLRTKTGEIITAIYKAEILKINGEGALLSTINDITYRKQIETEREKLILELREALTNVKTLSGLLPICSACKKIRNDKGYWEHIEQYIGEHSGADFSHGICPECAERLYPGIYDKIKDVI